MKIAIFTDTFTPQVNGVACTLQRLVEHLEKQGVEYRLFVPKAKEEDLFSTKVHRFLSIPFFLYPDCRLALPNVYSIRKELEVFNPDLIHIATPFNMGLAGLYYGKKLNIPIVGSYHTDFDQYLDYYDLAFLSKPVWKYMHWFHQSFLRTFVPSENTKKELQRRGFSNLSIWSRGVNCDTFHPSYADSLLRERYHIQEPHLITYVGRLAPEKNLELLMKTSQNLPPSIKKDVHWLIVGDGPLKASLKKEAPANMTFTGFQNGKTLTKLYASSSLFFFPSSTETFGNVVLEALACGTPVIGARAGGVQEIIQHNETGWLCEPDDLQAFTSAVVHLVEQDDQRITMGENARRYALTRSWEAVFSRLLSEYEEVQATKLFQFG